MIARAPGAQLGEAVVGGEAFPLFWGLLVTHAAVVRATTSQLARAFQQLFPDVPVPPRRNLLAAIGGRVQNEWYAQQGKEVPVAVKKQQAKREGAAVEAGRQAAAAPAEPELIQRPARERPARSNKKAAIRELVAQGLDDAAIFAQLKPKFANLTPFNVKWARAHPLKRGEG